ncbi:hypothetical protein CEXT_511781 [Caerostris extrusa]|uniref:Uncharacterized protein n=1 Tax=Caerostris extrusa TaxID=172846 RepID=A0AAV4MAC6_CAEEX|nr:hypothetical protein CEXT_511781 [Caerostris extrusa]
MLLESHPNRPLPISFKAFGGYKTATEREFVIRLADSHVRMKEESVLTRNRHSPMLVSPLDRTLRTRRVAFIAPVEFDSTGLTAI